MSEAKQILKELVAWRYNSFIHQVYSGLPTSRKLLYGKSTKQTDGVVAAVETMLRVAAKIEVALQLLPLVDWPFVRHELSEIHQLACASLVRMREVFPDSDKLRCEHDLQRNLSARLDSCKESESLLLWRAFDSVRRADTAFFGVISTALHSARTLG